VLGLRRATWRFQLQDNCFPGRRRESDPRPKPGNQWRYQPEEGRAQGPETPQGEQSQASPKKEATADKKAAKPAPTKEVATPRAESKGAKILELIGRPKGATLAEIVKARDWQKHSIRDFLSTAAKKHGLKIESTKTETGDRVYQTKK
jgi:hypothetical protein